MEIKYKKPKIQNTLVKESGDDGSRKKFNDQPRKKLNEGNRINIVKLNFQPDRGDTERKSKAGEKNIQEKTKDQTRRTKQNLNKKEIGKPKTEKLLIYQNTEELRNTELEKRRSLREKYTFRFNNMDGTQNHSDKVETSLQNIEYSEHTNFVERISKKQRNNSFLPAAAGTCNDSSDSIKIDKKSEGQNIKRKPIIKTITSNYDKAKVYKAVTFVDQKPQKTLQINLSTNAKKISRIPRLVNVKLAVSNDNHPLIEPIMNRKKKVKRLQRNSSPDLSMNLNSAPSTEVAKWAPASINPHTKPYYEAWVNTTLAATSRNAGKDKMLLQKEKLIRSIQREIDARDKSPELTYLGFTDERYAGRIKVHQRNGNRTMCSDSFRTNYLV